VLVAQRASHRCEYCRLPEQFVPVAFHVEHIIPKQHGGSDDPDNLCYSCNRCNWDKGPNLTGIVGRQIVPPFDPRRQSWDDHFAWQGALIAGLTPTGQATAQVLQMNAPRRLRLRIRLFARGLLP
jgi:5-methylcytosine-specific restriction endonuclease McrA